jgi:hypothetical protein
LSNNNAAKNVAQQAKERADGQPKQQGNQKGDQRPAQDEVKQHISDTEVAALIEENERINRELAELKRKHEAGQYERQARRYQGDGSDDIPEGHGVFETVLRTRETREKPSKTVFSDTLVAVDEGDAIRQALSEYCQKNGLASPPDFIREVKPVGNTLRERDDRLRFKQWRNANRAREGRGEDLLPLPPELSKFRDQLTEIERMATERAEAATT